MEGGRGVKKTKRKKATNVATTGVPSHANGQVVTVSEGAQDSANATHEPIMSKSKRKRIKKAAAAEALALKPAESTGKSTVSTALLIKKKVAVLAPPSATMPHVIKNAINIKSGKKKKRKLSALIGDSGTESASVALNVTSVAHVMEDAKVLMTTKSKTIVEHEGASSTGGTKPKAALLAAGKKRQFLAKQHAHKQQDLQSQRVHKKNSVAMNAASVAGRKSVKQVAMAASLPTTGKLNENGRGQDEGIKMQGKSVSYNPNGVTSAGSASTITAIKPDAVTHARQTGQTGDRLNMSQCRANQAQCIMLETDLLPKNEGNPAQAMAKRETEVSTIVSGTKPEKKIFGSNIATTLSTKILDTKRVAGATSTSGLSKLRPSSFTVAYPPQLESAQLASSQFDDEKIYDAALGSNGGLKPMRSVDQTFINTEISQPSGKHIAVASRDGSIQFKAGSRSAMPNETSVSIENIYPSPKTVVNVADSSVNALSTSRQMDSMVDLEDKSLLVTKEEGLVSRTSFHKRKEFAETIPVIASSTPNIEKLRFEKLSATGNVTHTINAPKERKVDSAVETNSEKAVKADKAGVVNDNCTNAKKMITTEGETRKLDTATDYDVHSSRPIVALPPRLPNAWGASFGLVPPAHCTSLASRTLLSSPLSSWFLSKGCANFVKHVHFSDGGSSDDDDDSLTQQLDRRRRADKSPPKTKASLTRKNAFLESLKHHCSWRTWYGNVDVSNLLDPPLAEMPEKGHIYDAFLSAVPEPMANSQVTASIRKSSKLEMLEADIRHEKLQGSAFSKQLLMMLQGKTAVGKSHEEYCNMVPQQ